MISWPGARRVLYSFLTVSIHTNVNKNSNLLLIEITHLVSLFSPGPASIGDLPRDPEDHGLSSTFAVFKFKGFQKEHGQGRLWDPGQQLSIRP